MKKLFLFALAILSCLNIFAQEDISSKYTVGQMKIGGGGYIPEIFTEGDYQYARTDVGGLYRRTATSNWEFVSNWINKNDNGFLSVDGASTCGNNIALACGCIYNSDGRSGVLISDNNGASFTTYEVTDKISINGNGNGRNCSPKISIAKSNTNIIYCAGRASKTNGQVPLIKSTDGGKTWNYCGQTNLPNIFTQEVNWPLWESSKKVYASFLKEPGNIYQIESATCVLANPNDENVVFIGLFDKNGNSFYYSNDGGNAWNKITLPNNNNYIPTKIKHLTANKFLVITSNETWDVNGSKAYTFEYSNNSVNNIQDISTGTKIGDIIINPDNSNQMFACTFNTWSKQNWNYGKPQSDGDEFYISNNGGKDWSKIEIFLDNPQRISWVDGYALHWCSGMSFVPGSNKKVTVGSGNGAFTCDDIWKEGVRTFNFDVNGIEEVVPLDLISIPNKATDNVICVIKDYTGFTHNSPNEFAKILNNPSGNTCAIAYDPNDPKRMARIASKGIYYTTDGTNWTKTQEYQEFSDNASCAISGDKIFIIRDKGKNLEIYNISSNNITSKSYQGDWVAVDPNNSNYVYICGHNSFYYSSDNGNSFRSTSTTIKNEFEWWDGRWGSRCATVVGKEGYIYMPTDQGNNFYVSKNHGQTFTKKTTLRDCYGIGTGIGQEEGQYTIYAYGKKDDSSPVGIYRSLDEGETWQLINKEPNCYGGLGNGMFIIGDNNTFGRFYMSSLGSGVIYGTPKDEDPKIAHWTSTSSQDWNLASNWDINQVPDQDYQVIIDKNTVNPIISDNQEVKSLEFEDNQILTITSNGSLTLEDATIGKGKIILSQLDENSDLGSFIYTGELDGKIQIDKKLRIGWNRISTPFNITDRVYTFSDKTFFNASLEKFDSEYIFSQDEMKDGDVKGTLANAWKPAHNGNKSNIATNLTIGQGYHFYNFDNVKTISTSGKAINSTSYSASTININNNAQYSGWVFAGNPFTSYLDLAEFFKDNSGTTVYVLNYLTGNYVTATQSELTNLKTIKNGQGFFVHYGTNAGAHEVIFSKEQQCAKADASSLSKNLRANRLQLALNDDNTIICLGEDYKDEFENGIDAIKLNNENSNIYSISNNLNLAINCVNFNNLDQKEIQLGFSCKNNEENTIKVENLTFEENDIFLIDKLQKDTINLKEENQYKFVGENSDERFSILISKKAVNQEDIIMGIDNIKSEEISIYPNPFVDKISIKLNQNYQNYSIVNLNGQTVKSDKISKNNFEIDLSNLASGIYIIKIDNQNFKIIKK